MKIIVGSKAAEYWGANRTHPSDTDVWVSVPSENRYKGYDESVIPLEILKEVPIKNGYATLDALYTIKCSHLGWNNPLWNKHKLDIIHFKNKEATLVPKLYEVLVAYWKEILGDKSFLSLKQDKENFFTDNVHYVYDHDWLHEQVAYPNQPVYKECLKDGEEVLIDKEKFNSLSFERKVKMFREEITVIAIERWLVNPSIKKNFSWVQAYNMSLQKTITNLTKNWATDFLVLNLEHFVKPDYSMFEYALKVTNKPNK